MRQPLTFQKLVLGSQPVETEAEKRKLLLGAYLIVMYLGIDAFFFIVNLFNPFGSVLSLFLGSIVSVICLLLIRRKWINAAIFLHLLRANILAYYFAAYDYDAYQTGSYIYFIPSCVGALAVFGYEERWKGIGFSMVTIVLFLIALFNWGNFTPDQPHFYFVFNFLIALIIVSLILLFFDRMVIGSEKKALQKNKELQKANAELDRFVYSVSHDLRAPLSSILGLVNIYEYASEDSEKNEIIEHIKARALKLDEFIGEILDYGRNTRTEVMHINVDLRKIIEEVKENLRYSKGYDRLNITIAAPETHSFMSDPERVKVIFNNLLSNAIKYQDQFKANSFAKISLEVTPEHVQLLVQDNGIGIKEEFLPKVFGMFFRANDLAEGSGLGLYIVKEAVYSLKGSIHIESVYGQGTSFKIVLPASTEPSLLVQQ